MGPLGCQFALPQLIYRYYKTGSAQFTLCPRKLVLKWFLTYCLGEWETKPGLALVPEAGCAGFPQTFGEGNKLPRKIFLLSRLGPATEVCVGLAAWYCSGSQTF